MKAKLIVVGGDAKAAEVNLSLPAIIGRGREASLTLPHPLVSRQHCEIYEDNSRLVVRDMGSLNGTFVNNQKIEEPTFLPSGDLLTVGTVTFRAVYEDPKGSESEEVDDPTDVENTRGPAEQTQGLSDATPNDKTTAQDQAQTMPFVEDDGMEVSDDDWAEDFLVDDDAFEDDEEIISPATGSGDDDDDLDKLLKEME